VARVFLFLCLRTGVSAFAYQKLVFPFLGAVLPDITYRSSAEGIAFFPPGKQDFRAYHTFYFCGDTTDPLPSPGHFFLQARLQDLIPVHVRRTNADIPSLDRLTPIPFFFPSIRTDYAQSAC